MDPKSLLAAIARAFGEKPKARVITQRGGTVIRTGTWDYTLESVPLGSPLTDAFRGTLYQAVPEVFIEGGGGLRSRWFAVEEDRVLALDQPADMRWFLGRYVSRDDPAALASFVEQCQGTGRMANVYRADGSLERTLDEAGQLAILELGLEEPALDDGELRFWTWRVVMHEGEEVIQLERWTVSLDAPDGAEWSSYRLPELLRLG
jgi:hypothetical protein